MDLVEGLGVANVENWVLVYTGNGLTYNVNSGLTPLQRYRFKVIAISEQNLQSIYSNVAEYVAAALPVAITVPSTPFTETTKTSLSFTWNKPTIDPTT